MSILRLARMAVDTILGRDKQTPKRGKQPRAIGQRKYQRKKGRQ